MGFLRTIFIFLITNIAIMLMISIVLAILSFFGINIDHNSYLGILFYSFLFGFSGSFLSLWLSKFLALRSVGGIIVTKARNNQEEKLLNIIDDLSKKWNIKPPQLAIFESASPNAFATGSSKNNSLIAVSDGLLNFMDNDEIEAVLGHEMSHIGNGDMVRMTLIQGIVNTFVIFFARLISRIVSQFLDDELSNTSYFIINILSQILFGFLASIIVMFFARKREYRADSGSAKFVGNKKMIKALQKLQKFNNKENLLPQAVNAFGITGNQDSLFSTHPSLENRIKALQH